jgi:hypothetical protein
MASGNMLRTRLVFPKTSQKVGFACRTNIDIITDLERREWVCGSVAQWSYRAVERSDQKL